MPIYPYRCENCGFQKDALQKLSDVPLRDCPECGQPRLVKQLTAAGFALKGTGWYVTDFRDSGKKSAPSDAAKPAAAAAEASGGAGETTSATPAAAAEPTSTSSATASASAPTSSATAPSSAAPPASAAGA
ncbi:MAG: zinc ribbon domain-containing protein [Betaproteobacteria bacterium]|jgi:putative FmdB family regulatory protein|nr:zinc ribbon domain-containing protein [Betaproteobacteria bacterium]